MRYVIAILGVLVVLGLLGGVKAAQIATLIGSGKKAAQAGPPPEVVATAVLQEASWESTISDVGSVASSKGVTLSAETSGIVTRLSFESGKEVAAGAPILELDTRVERSQLASAAAKRDLAATTMKRTDVLARTGSIAPAQVDADRTALDAANKDVAALEAQIARKVVRAPFAGRLGIRGVNLGQYLPAGTPIATLEQVKTVFVDFTTPQERLGELAIGMPVRLSLASDGAASRDGGASRDGQIAAIEPAIDPLTRAVRVRASVPNDDEVLRPGMFVRTTVLLPRTSKVVVAPATAIVHASYADSVFLVEGPPDRRVVRQQVVRVGEARGDFVSILDGASVGQEVVTAGAFKLKNGVPVAVKNELQPKPEIAPHPQNR